MSVESFDPSAATAPLDGQMVARLLELDPAGDDLGLNEAEQGSMGGLMTAPAAEWQAAAEPLEDGQIEHLIRVLTLAEEQFSGWQAGAKSPVIALVKVLKSRGGYDRSLTQWIKSNSNNRFLPHGSLMDRL